MYYKYLLRSKSFPAHTYVGSNSDLRTRLSEHNARKSVRTNKFQARELVTYVALPE